MNDVVPRRGLDPAAGIEAGPGAILLHAREAKYMRQTSLRGRAAQGHSRVWTLREDWASGRFETVSPGVFEVELLQGVGKAAAALRWKSLSPAKH